MKHDAELYISGAWISADERRYLQLENPATGESIGRVPIATIADIDEAIGAARDAFLEWRRLGPKKRSQILRYAAQLLHDRSEEIARLLSLEQGKVLKEAKIEVAAAVEHIEWAAEEGRRAYGRILPSRTENVRQSVIIEPVGIVAGFSPWNFPATSPAKKISTALAAGCCCILKAAEETPLTAVAIVKAFADAGLPSGVLALLFGDPPQISQRLIASSAVRKISFTGSVQIGRQVAALAASEGKPATLELGGHAPVLVFADCDVTTAARLGAEAKYRNAGQVCVSPTRFIIQRSIYDEFLDEFLKQASSIVVGEGVHESSQMGPLLSDRRRSAVEAVLRDAVDDGAVIATGGTRLGNKGYFFAPTVLTNVPEDARILREEPFGPIAIIQSFDQEATAISMANSTEYGLAAYAFTADAARQRRLASQLEVGLLGLNTFSISGPDSPWGGVGSSGYGREAGIEGLESCQIKKYVVEE